MNIRDLQYIKAVAKHRHFGRAAQACHVSQPALSSQIKKLETELGVTLFERDNKSVQVTDIGTEIIRLADEALTVVDNIRAAAQSAHDPLSGRLRLGTIPTIAPYLAPHFIRQTQNALPNLNVQFREDITERLNQSLLDGDLDVAILATPPEDPKLQATALYDESFWVIFPEAHSLRAINEIMTGDLPIDELLLLSEGHCFRDQAMDICKIGAAYERRAIRATGLETLVNMVAAGQGITLVPAMALGDGWTGRRGISAQKLSDKNAYRRIYLTARKSFPRQKLLSEIRQIISVNLPKSVQKIEL